MIIGYARTSTEDQKAGLADQVSELTAKGCTRVFQEQQSAKSLNRPKLDEALTLLSTGDILMVTKPDRLSRSVPDMIVTAKTIMAKGAYLRVLSMDIDTSTPTGELILTILGGVAAWERAIMLERQRAGIAAAKAAGKYRGGADRPTNIDPKVVQAMLDDGTKPPQIAEALGVRRESVWRVIKRMKSSDPVRP